MGMVRFRVPPNRLTLFEPSEQPLPNEKPQPPPEARAFLGEMTHIFNALFSALRQRQSAYASVIGALLELAGEKAQPVKVAPEEPLDASWSEPPAFDGCSPKGQSRPGQPQPIRIVRKDNSAKGAPA